MVLGAMGMVIVTSVAVVLADIYHDDDDSIRDVVEEASTIPVDGLLLGGMGAIAVGDAAMTIVGGAHWALGMSIDG